MFQYLKRRLHSSGSPSQRKTDADFIRLLNESYTYLRLHRYRVLSTELPGDLLKRWLMPDPDNPSTSEYMRNFIRQNNTLSEIYLPAFVFDHVLKHRFGRDIAAFGKSDMEDAARDLRAYILLLNYIFGMREVGRTPIGLKTRNRIKIQMLRMGKESCPTARLLRCATPYSGI